MECCGASGPSDWAGSKYNTPQTESLGLAISSPEQPYKIPTSCCYGDATQCSEAQTAVASGSISKFIYSEVWITNNLSFHLITKIKLTL